MTTKITELLKKKTAVNFWNYNEKIMLSWL